MNRFSRGFWLYPLFQIPAIFLVICLILATLFWLLGLGRPNVSVAIVLDLSSSTYEGNKFNAPDTIMAKEVAAVNSYLVKNDELQSPSRVQVFGFRSNQVLSLTESFETDSQKISKTITQKLNDPSLLPSLPEESETDDLNKPIQQAINALSSVQYRCRELLTVSDRGVQLSPSNLVSEALDRQIKINSIVFGGNVPNLQTVASATGGTYLSGDVNSLETFFTKRVFSKFNSNLRWIILWLGSAWVFLMWTLTLPLDQWVFQGWMKLPMNLSGQLALGNALFWSVATPLIAWRLWQIFGLPFFSSC